MYWSNTQVEIPSRQLVVSRAWEGIKYERDAEEDRDQEMTQEFGD